MANKTLTATVKLNTSSAEASLKKLSKKINDVQKAVTKVGTNSKLATNINKAAASTDKLRIATNKWATATNKVLSTTSKVSNTARKINTANHQATNSAWKLGYAYRSANGSASGLLGTVKRLASTYLGIMGAKAVIETSDVITSSENRLNNIKGANPQNTQEALDKIYAAAQRSRSGYGDMMGNVSKTMTLAGDSFQGNIDNAIRFQEIMSKAYTVGGASAAEQASSMYQLVQALGSGVLQGDELRSLREGAPIAYKKIEEFAQGVLKTEDSLKDLASQGVITSDIVVAAIMDAEEEINKSFKNTDKTFAQVWNNIKNTAIKAFEPVLQKLNDALNSDVCEAAIDGIGKALVVLADITLWVFDILGRFFNWCKENWDWLKNVVIVAMTVIVGYITWMTISAVIAFLVQYWWIILIIGAIALLIYVFSELGIGVDQVVGAICGAIMFLGYLIWDIVVWIITICYYAISLIWDALVGIAVGIIEAVIGILTVIVWVIQAIVQVILWVGETIWATIVTIYDVIYTILKGVYGAFKGAIVGIYQLFVWLGQSVLWILYGIAECIDFIFGSSLASSVKGWIDGLGNSVDALDKKLDPLGEFEDIGNQWSSSYGSLGEMYTSEDLNLYNNMAAVGDFSAGLIKDFDEAGASLLLDPTALDEWALGKTINPMDGWDKGYKFGSDAANNVSSAIDSYLKSPDFGKGVLNPNDPSYALGDSYDPSGANDDILAGLDTLNGTTDDIKDKMDMTDDDLDFLRKIAEMEWRNEFTTAEIKVDMTNYNSVNGDRDLDGVVEYLADVLRGEMTNVAYGVHS